MESRGSGALGKGIAALAAAALLLVPAPGASGAALEPTRFDDPNPNGCKPKNCSLREAVIAANGTADEDTIRLREGRYRLEIPETMFDPNDSSGGDLDLAGGGTIRGMGAARTTIDGRDVSRILHLQGSLNDYTVRGLTLEDGRAAGTGGPQGGAVIASNVGGTLALVEVVLASNEAGEGGGLFLLPAEVSIKRSRIIGNTATYGGGIESRARGLTISQTTVAGNTAVEGGGIDLRPADALPLTKLVATTVAGNSATFKAGGILADGNPYSGPDPPEEPELLVFNSTVAGNTSNGDAGGIMGDNLATVDLDNASVGFNRANDDEVGTAVAGGIYQHSGAVFTVNDSVLATNGAGQGGGDLQCSGTFTGTGNVINAPTGCTSFTPPDNSIPASSIASNLADNGGPTKTMELSAGSAAIGFANDCPKRDQRGRRRPANCDSGSFEDNPKR